MAYSPRMSSGRRVVDPCTEVLQLAIIQVPNIPVITKPGSFVFLPGVIITASAYKMSRFLRFLVSRRSLDVVVQKRSKLP